MEHIQLGLMWYFIFLFSTVFHEASHAFFAMKLGDDTAYMGGQASLDPLPHIKKEPFGTVVIPILSFMLGGWMFGWARTPYNPVWAYRYPDRSALMSLAGPVSNLALAVISALLIRAGIFFGVFYAPESLDFSHITAATNGGIFSCLAVITSIFFSLNIILFVFNLIPLPPLDGSGSIPLFLNESLARKYLDFMNTPGIMFFGLLIAWKAFDLIFDPIHLFFINLLYPGLGYH